MAGYRKRRSSLWSFFSWWMRAGSPIYHLGVLGNKLLEVSGLFGSWIWTEVARVTGLFHNIVPAKLRNTTIYALDWIAEHLVAKGSWHSMSHESLKYAKYNSSTKQSANCAGHQTRFKNLWGLYKPFRYRQPVDILKVPILQFLYQA